MDSVWRYVTASEVIAGRATVGTINATTYLNLPEPTIPDPLTVDNLTVADTATIGTCDATTYLNLPDPVLPADLTCTSLTATGDVSGGTLTGTLQTAAQPNVTSVGTLDSLDVTGTTTLTGLTATGDVNFGSATSLALPELENDLICTITQSGVPASFATPTNINNTGIYGFSFGSTTQKDISFQVQLSHQWKEGSDVTPHFHWCTSNTNTNTMVFKLDYWVVNMGEVISGVTTLTQTITPGGVAYKHTLSSLGTVSMTGKTASCIFGGRLYRATADANDTHTGTVYVLGVDLHVKNNRWGYNV
jgi:hypothetical protein